MADKKPLRKLATIVAVDVAGYSARTEADEVRTTSEVAALRPLIDSIAEAHGGRVFNTAGDGFMVEFGSSLSGVEAAREIAERAEPRVRVGVHVGDVIVQDNGDLLGHGVNVAARLMARSEPGSLLVSADVRRMIRGPIADQLTSCGMLQLDKMAETIEGFVLRTGAPSTIMPQPKATEPLLAVLPFDNLSNDPEMQFFSDGVSEEIMQRLMRGAKLKVVGRTSSFQFRGERKGDASKSLHCTHILDGSVRRAASSIRVSAHLVDTSSQTTLWSDRFDSPLENIFAVQDEISENIASALRRTFSSVSSKSIDPAAYDLYLRGIQTAFVSKDLLPGINALEEATRRAPQFAEAWGKLAELRAHYLYRRPYAERTELTSAVQAEASRALALDNHNPAARLANLLLLPPWGRFIEAETMVDPLLKDAHTDGYTFQFSATHYMSVGRMRDAAAIARRGFELDALNPLSSHLLGFCLWYAGQNTEAKKRTESALARAPDNHFSAINLILMAAEARDWPAVDALMAPKRLAQYPLRQFERAAIQYVAMCRDPSPELRDRSLQAARKDLAETGYVDLPALAIVSHFGGAEEAHQIAAAAKFRPAADGRDQMGFDAYRSYFLFHAYWPEFRRDPRFAKICARLGLVDYWRTTQHWPDCEAELAPYYDFRAECEKIA